MPLTKTVVGIFLCCMAPLLAVGDAEKVGPANGLPSPVVASLRGELQPLIDQHIPAAAKKALAALAEGNKQPALFKTSLYLRAVENPWSSLGELEEQGLGLAGAARGEIAHLPKVLDRLGRLANKSAGRADAVARPKASSLADHARYITAVLDRARVLLETALAKFSPEERRFLFDRPPAIIRDFYPQFGWDKKTRPRLEADRTFCAAAHDEIDWSKLMSAAHTMLRLTEPAYLAELRQALEAAQPLGDTLAGVSGDILFKQETAHGLILFGGKGPNRYDFQAPPAFLADLGGGDHYKGMVAASGSAERPFALAIDFAGDDTYECAPFGLACGRLGVGILLDLAGKDTYKLSPGSGGAGFAGIGLLGDASGDDTYSGSSWTQGVGFSGIGLLLDVAGNDTHTSFGYALGLGGPDGVGAVVDVAGNDSYQCGKHFPSGYNQSDAPNARPGDPGFQFDAWGLGCGVGRRVWPPSAESDPFQLAGGVGLVIDLAGNDRYESSNFSQACGYFFGAGLLFDLDGNDEYLAARYGLAAGAHRGLGLFIDYRGEDKYNSTGPTYNGGCAWDRSVFLFIDVAGDDTYALDRSQGFGRADHGSWGVFADRAGKDRYLGSGFGQADADSLAIFFDGAGPDDYKGARSLGDFRPADAQTHVPAAGGLFLDR